MAELTEEKAKEADSVAIEMTNVRALVSEAEKRTYTNTKGRQKRKGQKQCNLVLAFVRSRYIGLVIGPLYGVFVYWYVTYLILSGPPFMVEMNTNLTMTMADGNVTIGGGGLTSDGRQIKASKEEAEADLVDRSLGQCIGGSVGGGCALFLTVGSMFSPKTRCAMMLIIPSLGAKRGRAFLLTSATAVVLSGPIKTIDYNIQQIVTSLTCMYEQTKSLADRYVEQFEPIWNSVQQILRQTNTIINMYQEKLSELAEDATEQARRQIQETQRDIQRQVDQLKDRLSVLDDVLSAPVKGLDVLCDAGSSILAAGKDAVNAIVDVAETGWKETKQFFESLFGRRRKRGSCGIPSIIPDVKLDIPGVDLNALKDFVSKLKPDIDLLDFDLSQLLGQLEHNSIHEIRERLKNILKLVFELIKTYSSYITKLFYLSIVLVVADAVRYMKSYYSDDAFDNMMVDDNLRQLWKTGDKEKILPLRRWELKLRYQYSKSVKMSKPEVKHIIIRLIPTFLFIIATALIMVGDYSLSALLTVFREQAKFGITFEGSEQGVSVNSLIGGLQTDAIDSLVSIKLEGFNLSSEPCLPHPKYTDQHVIIKICFLMLFALLLSITDAYGSRTRAIICNLYFTRRAKERAEYLYRRIQTGRRTRRIQLSMIISQELDRRYRADRFYCPYFKADCCSLCSKKAHNRAHNRLCPACLCTMKNDNEARFSLSRNGTKEDVAICKDCHKDVQ